MKLWIARDKDGSLYFYKQKPQLTYRGNWINKNDTCFVKLPITEFPEVTFENSPQEVELTLCNHIDTVNIQDCNPKKQTCVLTNHGIVTDVIFK